MEKEHREPESLINMRTHLTVLTLALAQLQRRHGGDADIGRLCRLADTATRQLHADIADVEVMLRQAESREQSRQVHLPLRQSVNTDVGRLDTGPLDLPSPTRDRHPS